MTSGLLKAPAADRPDPADHPLTIIGITLVVTVLGVASYRGWKGDSTFTLLLALNDLWAFPLATPAPIVTVPLWPLAIALGVLAMRARATWHWLRGA